jgi:putative lipase involved disintegration of autophagic bodies
MLPITLTGLLIPLLDFLSFNTRTETIPPRLSLELRHLHTLSPYGHVLFSDVTPQALYVQHTGQNDTNSYTVQTKRSSSFRPPSFAAFSQARTRSIKFGQSEKLQWDEEEIIGPDVESRTTLLELAKMTNNAYVEPDDPAWYDLEGNWNDVRCCPDWLVGFHIKNSDYRAILSVGSQMRMGFAGTYSPQRITKQLYCPSRVHLLAFLVEAGQR